MSRPANTSGEEKFVAVVVGVDVVVELPVPVIVVEPVFAVEAEVLGVEVV
jgi:hypothetical protein